MRSQPTLDCHKGAEADRRGFGGVPRRLVPLWAAGGEEMGGSRREPQRVGGEEMGAAGGRLAWFFVGLRGGCKELFDVLGNLRYTVAVYFINRSNEGIHDVHRF